MVKIVDKSVTESNPIISTVESALYVVSGFAGETYLIATHNGTVLFEDASIMLVTVTPSQ